MKIGLLKTPVPNAKADAASNYLPPSAVVHIVGPWAPWRAITPRHTDVVKVGLVTLTIFPVDLLPAVLATHVVAAAVCNGVSARGPTLAHSSANLYCVLRPPRTTRSGLTSDCPHLEAF